MEYFYILDLTGTFAFAVYGAYIGLKKNFDYVGIFLCAFLVAVGGGTVREIILNRTPFYFHDYNYIYTIFIGVIFCAITYNYFHKINKAMLVLDAVGLSTFAYIGATKAIEANLGFFGAVFFAVLTAIGGGIMRDIVANRMPSTFLTKDFYAGPVLISGVLQYLFKDYMHYPFAVLTLLSFTFMLRISAIFLDIDFRKWHYVVTKRRKFFRKALSYAARTFF